MGSRRMRGSRCPRQEVWFGFLTLGCLPGRGEAAGESWQRSGTTVENGPPLGYREGGRSEKPTRLSQFNFLCFSIKFLRGHLEKK